MRTGAQKHQKRREKTEAMLTHVKKPSATFVCLTVQVQNA